eukprot:TRINITY_DN8337_c0_g1_i2.p1 TRINITY_DN8337_c0_g1~~TRINITY_DN8337_c0_g1_i2.p1  ORF type:complete len:657 (+),score=106.81 TRINITY_DN8337_c0_g1_i2:144-2114(+)
MCIRDRAEHSLSLQSFEDLGKTILSARHEYPAVKVMKFIVWIWFALLIFFGVMEYQSTTKTMTKYNEYATVIIKGNSRVALMNLILARVQDLALINSGLMESTPENLEKTRNSLVSAIAQLNNVTESLIETSLYSYLENYKMFVPVELYSNSVNNQTTQELFYEEALQSVLAFALNVSSSPIEELNYKTNNDFQLINNNIYNKLYPTYENLSVSLQKDVDTTIDDLDIEMLIYAALLGLTSVLMLTFMASLVASIATDKMNVLFLFLDIPRESITRILTKCSRFVRFLGEMDQKEMVQNNDQEEDLSEESMSDIEEHFQDREDKDQHKDSEESQDSEFESFLQRKKLLKFYKKQRMKAKDLWGRFFLLFLMLQVYSGVTIYISFYEKDRILTYMDHLYDATQIQDRHMVIYNLMRMEVFDPGMKMYGQDIDVVRKTKLRKLPEYRDDAFEFEVYITNNPTDDISIIYKRVFYGDACQLLENPDARNDCRNTMKSHFTVGLQNAMAQLFKFFREHDEDLTNKKVDKDTFYRSSSLKEMDTVLFVHLRGILTNLFAQELTIITATVDSSIALQTVMLVVYILLLSMIFLIRVLPYISSLNSDIWRTTGMLTMIPYKVILSIQSIRRHLVKLVKQYQNTIGEEEETDASMGMGQDAGED